MNKAALVLVLWGLTLCGCKPTHQVTEPQPSAQGASSPPGMMQDLGNDAPVSTDVQQDEVVIQLETDPMRRLLQIEGAPVDLWMAAHYKTGKDFRQPYCQHLLAQQTLEVFRVAEVERQADMTEEEYERLEQHAIDNPRTDQQLVDYCKAHMPSEKSVFDLKVTASGGRITLFTFRKLRVAEQYDVCSREIEIARIKALHAPGYYARLVDDSSRSEKLSGEAIPIEGPFKDALDALERIQRQCERERQTSVKKALSIQEARDSFEAHQGENLEDARLLALARVDPSVNVLDLVLDEANKLLKDDESCQAGEVKGDVELLTCRKGKLVFKSSPPSMEAVIQMHNFLSGREVFDLCGDDDKKGFSAVLVLHGDLEQRLRDVSERDEWYREPQDDEENVPGYMHHFFYNASGQCVLHHMEWFGN